MAIINYFPVWSSHADSEHSLSVNTRVVTKERSRLREQTIVDLRLLKDAVKFHEPVKCRPEKIPVAKEMRKSVRFGTLSVQGKIRRRRSYKKLGEKKRKKKTEEREGEVVEVQGFFGKDRGGYFKG